MAYTHNLYTLPGGQAQDDVQKASCGATPGGECLAVAVPLETGEVYGELQKPGSAPTSALDGEEETTKKRKELFDMHKEESLQAERGLSPEQWDVGKLGDKNLSKAIPPFWGKCIVCSGQS
eukprot:1158097-Pelagomonas_calceolata.AAC.2